MKKWNEYKNDNKLTEITEYFRHYALISGQIMNKLTKNNNVKDILTILD